MNVIRFSDLIEQGRVAGQRVFIRADLNVPQDDAGNITEDTGIFVSGMIDNRTMKFLERSATFAPLKILHSIRSVRHCLY